MEPIVDITIGMSSLRIEDKPTGICFEPGPNKIPQEVCTGAFFDCVTGVEWGSLLLTSKSWCTIASDPKSWKILFDREGLRYFDLEKCRKYRGEPGPVPHISLPKAYGYFNSDSKLFPGKKVKETEKLQLFYNEIDEKPMTLNYAGALAKTPKNGVAARFSQSTCKNAFEVLGDRLLGESFWGFIAVMPLEGSANINFEEKLKLVAKHPDYRLHKVVERSIANFDNVVETGEYLDAESSWTICEDVIEYGRGCGGKVDRLIIGGAGVPGAPGGLDVYHCEDYYRSRGVALLREFKPIDT